MSSLPQDLTLSNVPQTLTLGNVPQNLTLSNVPQTLTLNNVPQQPQGGLSAVEPQPEIVVMPRYANPQNEMPVMPRPEMNWDIIFPEIPAYDVSAAYRASAEASRQAKIAAAKQAYATNPDAFLASMQKPAAPTPMPQPVMPQPVTPQYDMPVMPTPMPSSGIGAFLGKFGEAPQGVGTPPVASQQLINALTRQPKQGSFVDTMPTITMPAPTGPQVMPPNAQGMALGGLMRKYY